MDIWLLSKRKSLFKPVTKIEKLPIDEEIKLVAHGLYNILIVTTQNNLYGYGCFLDQFSTVTRNLQRIENNNFGKIKLLFGRQHYFVFVNEENEIHIVGNFRFPTKYFKVTENIKKITGGNGNLFMISEDNNLLVFGRNSDGELGVGSTDDCNVFTLVLKDVKVKDVQCAYHSVVLDYSGNIFVCGTNIKGELGLGNEVKRVTEFTKVNLNFKVVSISVGPESTFILNEYNEVLVTGDNYCGRLGLDTEKHYNVFVFTKVVIDCNEKIRSIYTSDYHYTIISCYNNDFLVTGENHNEMLAKNENCKMLTYKNEQIAIRFLDKFRKLDLNIKSGRKYVYPLLIDKNEIGFVASDISEIEKVDLGFKCFLKLHNTSDITIKICQ